MLKRILFGVLCTTLVASNLLGADESLLAKDAGYMFVGPRVITRTKSLKSGIVLRATHQSGVIVSENPKSPWHHATFFAQGTLVQDAQGKTLKEVALCETTDPDGHMTFGFLWRPAGEAGTFQFAVGTGKWENIVGSATFREVVKQRVDGHEMPTWQLQWQISSSGPPDMEKRLREGQFTQTDKCLSFHGPHIKELTRELENGVQLMVSNQSGVLLTENPQAVSPRNYATCFDRGTTITLPDSNGDVMLLEDTDPDGDVAWLAHVWWYGKGPGTYRFLGGTGKWEGITGLGITRGMVRKRADDHFMLKSELRWRIDKAE